MTRRQTLSYQNSSMARSLWSRDSHGVPKSDIQRGCVSTAT